MNLAFDFSLLTKKNYSNLQTKYNNILTSLQQSVQVKINFHLLNEITINVKKTNSNPNIFQFF